MKLFRDNEKERARNAGVKFLQHLVNLDTKNG